MTEPVAKKPPLVAIVTPVYNGGKYLAETMACVQAQTYPNLVHVVLDNASTDNTADIIKQFSGGKVPVLAHRNSSVLRIGENWNAAMNLAPADAAYIRLLCADDLMTPDMTERMVELAEQDKSLVVVATNVRLNDEQLDFRWPAGQSVMDGKEFTRRLLSGDIGFWAVHTLMPRAVLDWQRPLFDPEMLSFDVDTALAVLARGNFGMVHDCLGWVRDHDTSQTSTIMYVRNTHFPDFLTMIYRYGPAAFSDAAFKQAARRFEYHYLRRLRRWRKLAGSEAISTHLETLARFRGSVGPKDNLLALIDGGLIRLGLRRGWSGWPR